MPLLLFRTAPTRRTYQSVQPEQRALDILAVKLVADARYGLLLVHDLAAAVLHLLRQRVDVVHLDGVDGQREALRRLEDAVVDAGRARSLALISKCTTLLMSHAPLESFALATG